MTVLKFSLTLIGFRKSDAFGTDEKEHGRSMMFIQAHLADEVSTASNKIPRPLSQQLFH